MTLLWNSINRNVWKFNFSLWTLLFNLYVSIRSTFFRHVVTNFIITCLIWFHYLSINTDIFPRLLTESNICLLWNHCLFSYSCVDGSVCFKFPFSHWQSFCEKVKSFLTVTSDFWSHLICNCRLLLGELSWYL